MPSTPLRSPHHLVFLVGLPIEDATRRCHYGKLLVRSKARECHREQITIVGMHALVIVRQISVSG